MTPQARKALEYVHNAGGNATMDNEDVLPPLDQVTDDHYRCRAVPECPVCKGAGWHWGWGKEKTDRTRPPVRIVCGCYNSEPAIAS